MKSDVWNANTACSIISGINPTKEANSMQEIMIRRAAEADVTELFEVMNKVSAALPDKRYFYAEDRAFIKRHIEERGFVLQAAVQEKIVGFLLVRIPEYEEDNLGKNVALSHETLRRVAHMEIVVVTPQYRGLGIQKRVLKEAEKILVEKGYEYLMATVSPLNQYSLNNFLSLGYKIVKTEKKYGGYDRHILMKCKIM
jgi:ribosomal protein S18 acetylase RimI-like enzyme